MAINKFKLTVEKVYPGGDDKLTALFVHTDIELERGMEVKCEKWTYKVEVIKKEECDCGQDVYALYVNDGGKRKISVGDTLTLLVH